MFFGAVALSSPAETMNDITKQASTPRSYEAAWPPSWPLRMTPSSARRSRVSSSRGTRARRASSDTAAAEAIGKPITLVIPPDRLDEEPKILERLRRGERVDHFQTVRVRKDGALVDISLTVSPIRNAAGEIIGASKIARDITAQKRADESLRVSNERFRLMANSAPVLIWIADNAKSRVWFNKAWLEFTGRALEDEAASAGRRTCMKTTWRNACRPTARDSTRASPFAPSIASGGRTATRAGSPSRQHRCSRDPPALFRIHRVLCRHHRTEKASGGARRDTDDGAIGPRGSGARRPIEGRVPGDGLARAAHASQRHPRAGRPCCAGSNLAARTTGAASRPSSAMRVSRRRSSATCWT